MSYKPVNQERFIEDVLKAFKENNLVYTTKSILCTWKDLLDNYQYYKQNFADDDARRQWKYFDLMDNCFEKPKDSSEKFKNPKWTFCLINSLSKYRSTVLKQGLTMQILQAVEDDFQKMENYDINQKDIYIKWVSLKKFYRQCQRSSCSKFNKKYIYYEAIKDFFEEEATHEYTSGESSGQTVNKVNEIITQNELISAIESITPTEENTEIKRKIDISHCDSRNAKMICPAENKVTPKVPKERFSIKPRYTPFTVVMHDILLQCFKKSKTKIRTLGGDVDNDTLDNAFKEFQKLGYSVTKQSIRNEWNDLTYRYELIKNTEYPQNWPYFNDMNYIYSSEFMEEDCADMMGETRIIDTITDGKNHDNESNIDDLISDDLGQTLGQAQKIAGNDARITERLLNVYESNSKEFVEIKDILIERNLLREETNYLLNAFVEKFNKPKH
ncbi:hypothetical protein NQ314_000079 [Rhamnusium bicolor]|uniref:MADF domain-containing protein n=1 Tax=Rhamnusium bicolor TaxID=1586634 RepID=A0AAV8ZYF2_9CUCU|nr:hypothetical protein NQ314_000079 [Rhamnusium bicolor]